MRLMPGSLLTRVMLLIALLLIAGQYAAFRLFDYFEREPRAAAAALQAVSVVNLTRAALLAADENKRLALLAELSQTEGIRVYPIEIFEVAEPLPDDPLAQLIAQKIITRLGEGTVVSINHLGLPGLWVSFSIDEEDFWVVVPRTRMPTPDPWQWAGWASLMLVLSLAGAYVIAVRINRPLSLLAKAADQLARGEPVSKLPSYSVDELQRVSHTFNAMTDALARLDAERTLLLAGISHDLRTPLARLRLAVEMLPGADSLKSGMVQDIEDMDAIIHQFLDFVRGVEGEVPQQDDLNGLITAMADRYARTGHHIHLNLAPLPPLMLRQRAMQRLLGNLIDNAHTYGNGNVEIVTRQEGKTVVISVLDRGPGVPEQEMARLLRPFERLDTARGQSSSSGLGLAIADRIARLHGGTLSLHNRPGGGLEVRLTLPL